MGSSPEWSRRERTASAPSTSTRRTRPRPSGSLPRGTASAPATAGPIGPIGRFSTPWASDISGKPGREASLSWTSWAFLRRAPGRGLLHHPVQPGRAIRTAPAPDAGAIDPKTRKSLIARLFSCLLSGYGSVPPPGSSPVSSAGSGTVSSEISVGPAGGAPFTTVTRPLKMPSHICSMNSSS